VSRKLDISKSYDKMNWDYMSDVMIKMSFNNQWIYWMTICVESIDYSILINKEADGPVIPECGLRE